MDFLAPLAKNVVVELITKGSCTELDAHRNDTRCRHQDGRVRREVHLSGVSCPLAVPSQCISSPHLSMHF